MNLSVKAFFLLGITGILTFGQGKLNAAAASKVKPAKNSTAVSDTVAKSNAKASGTSKKSNLTADKVVLSKDEIKNSNEADEEKLLKIRQREKAREEEKAHKANKDSTNELSNGEKVK